MIDHKNITTQNCPHCKGTGKIILLVSEVDCDCTKEGSLSRLDKFIKDLLTLERVQVLMNSRSLEVSYCDPCKVIFDTSSTSSGSCPNCSGIPELRALVYVEFYSLDSNGNGGVGFRVEWSTGTCIIQGLPYYSYQRCNAVFKGYKVTEIYKEASNENMERFSIP